MKTKLIKFNELNASNWANGKTYEYYIYPNNADYQNKDFLFRISSATIDNEPSNFTNFIGYQRFLCMLDNSLLLKINNKEIKLEPYQLVEFKSEDSVISYTTGNDFNLMIKEDIKDYQVEITHGFFALENDFIIVYSLNNNEVFINDQAYLLEEKDCLIIENIDNKSIDLISGKDIILAQLNLAHHSFF